MYQTTIANHDAIAHGISQVFKPIYEAEFSPEFSSEINFYQRHLWFITLTFNQAKITLKDRLGLSTGHCPSSTSFKTTSTSFEYFNALPISKLRSIARKRGIQNTDQLHKIDLIFALQGPPGSFDPSLQRPIVAVRPTPHPLHVFQYLHFKITRACLGGNLHRKVRYQPVALAYVDFEGTRYGASVDPLHSSWVHVHAMMFVRPQHTMKFEMMMAPLVAHFKRDKLQEELDSLLLLEQQHHGLASLEQSRRLELVKTLRQPSKVKLFGDLTALHDIQCQRYNANNPLAELMGYSSKGSDQVPVQFVRKGNRWHEGVHSGAEDLYQVFPRQRELS